MGGERWPGTGRSPSDIEARRYLEDGYDPARRGLGAPAPGPEYEMAVQASQTQAKLIETGAITIIDGADVSVLDHFNGRTQQPIAILGWTVHESSIFPFPATPARLIVELHISPPGATAAPALSLGSITTSQWVWDTVAGPSFIGWDGTYPTVRFMNAPYPIFVPADSQVQTHAWAENVGANPVINVRLLFNDSLVYPIGSQNAVILPPRAR